MANLILVRHGESEWNQKGLWTGLTDIGLSEKGKEESRDAGEKLKGFSIDIAYISPLIRAEQTLTEIKNVLRLTNFPIVENQALNERNYGIFTGKNKWEIQKKVGNGKFQKIRRGWDSPIPKGETLKNVYNRVVPYYSKEILPKLKKGKNILIVAHGNSLRALVKYLENLSDEDVEALEIATGEVYIYNLNDQGITVSKQIKH